MEEHCRNLLRYGAFNQWLRQCAHHNPGDCALIYGIYQSAAGTYYDSLSTGNGCDSVHSTVLTFNPTYSINDPGVGTCSSDSTLIYGTYQFAAGTYYDSLATGNGCDSVPFTGLTINTCLPPTAIFTASSVSICEGDIINLTDL